MTPRIDSVLDRFHQRGPLSSETDAGEEKKTENPVMIYHNLSIYCIKIKLNGVGLGQKELSYWCSSITLRNKPGYNLS